MITQALLRLLITGILAVDFFYPGISYAELQTTQIQKTGSLEQVLTQYLKIQSSLSSDSMQGVTEAAHALRKFTYPEKYNGIQSAASELEKAATLEDGRKAFRSLSKPMVKWIEAERPGGTIIVYCPMAGAKWAQKDGAVSNPFYGKEMAACGEKLSF